MITNGTILATTTHRKPAGKAMIEPLEARRLLSVSMQDGVVVVNCTDGQDSAQVFSMDGGVEQTLVVEIWSGDHGTCANFRLADVSGIQVNGMGGEDEFIADDSYGAALTIPVVFADGAAEDVHDDSVVDDTADATVDHSDQGEEEIVSAADEAFAVAAPPTTQNVFSETAVDGDNDLWAL